MLYKLNVLQNESEIRRKKFFIEETTLIKPNVSMIKGVSVARWGCVWHWQWPTTGRPWPDSNSALHDDLQHVCHDDALQRDQCSQDSRPTQRVHRAAEKPRLHRYLDWHICCAGTGQISLRTVSVYWIVMAVQVTLTRTIIGIQVLSTYCTSNVK